MTATLPTHPTLPLRGTPDPSAPNALPPTISKLISFLAALLALLTLPFSAIDYLLSLVGYYTLPQYLFARFFRRSVQFNPFIPAADNDPTLPASLSPLPAPTIPFAKGAWDGVVLTKVSVPPAPVEWCGALAASSQVDGEDVVKRTTVTEFILTPDNATGRGTDTAKEGEKFVLYLHGGLAKELGVRIMAAQYRKATSPTTAFPGPLRDALAAWHYATTTLAFHPSQIVLMGDSVGGHLCLMLVQQLVALTSSPNPTPASSSPTPTPSSSPSPAFHLPASLVLSSPMADFTLSHPPSPHDFVTHPALRRNVQSATRYYAPEALRSPVFSPALAPEGTWVPLKDTRVLVAYGTAETFCAEIRMLVGGLRGDGVGVDVLEEQDGLHDGPISPMARPETYPRFRDALRGLLDSMAKDK